MSSCMLREGSFLLKQPDIIVPDLDSPRSFTLIDVVTHRRILPSSLLPLHASSMRHRCCFSSFTTFRLKSMSLALYLS